MLDRLIVEPEHELRLAPASSLDAAQGALGRAKEHLLSLQYPDGHWRGLLQTNVTMTAEHVLLLRFLGVPHELKGEAIWCFVVLTRDGDDLEQELRTFVGDGLGKPSHRTGSSPSRPSLARGTGRSSGARSALRSPERAPATSARSRTPRRWRRSRRVQP